MRMRLIERFVFPRALYCMSCGAIIDETRPYLLCDECVKAFHWNNGASCKICGKALGEKCGGFVDKCYECMRTERSFERGYSCLTYGSMEKKPLLGMKYYEKGYLYRPLAEMLCDRLKAVVADEYYGEIPWDVIVPVPIHKKRMLIRGYNQAELIAEDTAKTFNIPVESRALARIRETGKMNSLSPEERAANIESAFAVEDGRGILGKRVLLVDDIYTTGATAEACSRILLEAGAKSVHIATIATGANYFTE